MKIQKHIKVELLRKKAARPIEAVQYDTGNQIIFEITDFDLPTGTSATVYFQKPSGKFVYQEDDIAISGSNITVDLHNQALTEHGKIYYQVRIENGADLITTFTGLMLVDKSLADSGATESKTVLAAFAELTAEKIAEIQASAAAEKAELIAELQAVAANERKSIEDTGAATLATIPAEYTDTAEKATAAYYGRAKALAAEASGNPVQIYPDEGSLLNPVLTFNPIQPGSGDPYPAGGGKNLANYTVPVSGYGLTFNAEENGFSVSGTPTITYNKQIFTGAGLKAGVYTLSVRYDGSVSGGGINVCINADIQRSVWKSGTLSGTYSITFELTADIESFSIHLACDTNVTYNISVTEIQLEAGSTVTPYAPYSNIRPITGRTGAELVRCGKNIINHIGNSMTLLGLTFTVNADRSITINGTATDDVFYTLSDTGWTLKPGIYTMHGTPTDGAIEKYYMYLYPWYHSDVGAGKVFEINEEAEATMRIYVKKGTVCNNLIFRPMIELGSTATRYEPYQGETFSASFGQTVYGGTVDVNTGAMTVDHVVKTFDGSETFTYHDVETAGHIFRYFMADTPIDTLYESNLICDRYAPTTFHGRKEKSAYISIAGHVDFIDSNYDAETWPAYVKEQYEAGTPLTICYKLANPYTVQLDPVQVEALAGANTLFTDADGLTVGYNKSLNKAFEDALARIAALEAAAVNNV